MIWVKRVIAAAIITAVFGGFLGFLAWQAINAPWEEKRDLIIVLVIFGGFALFVWAFVVIANWADEIYDRRHPEEKP